VAVGRVVRTRAVGLAQTAWDRRLVALWAPHCKKGDDDPNDCESLRALKEVRRVALSIIA
jgi:hypothetical protein